MDATTSRRPKRPLWAEIDPAALAHNLEYVRRLAGKRQLIASVKANAYGHGAVEFAKPLRWVGQCVNAETFDRKARSLEAGFNPAASLQVARLPLAYSA